MSRFTTQALTTRVAALLQDAGASPEMAQSTARALVRAEAQGLHSHGMGRVAQYAGHLRSGRVNGQAQPRIVHRRGGAFLVDADEGLAFPACDHAIAQAIALAPTQGVVLAGVTRSHHFGPAGIHLEAVGRAGLVGLAFSNSPSAMPAWGGKRALFGTNPIAAIFPRRSGDPIAIDLSLSEVARGKLMVAAREGKPIPEGWALDSEGRPTTDPAVGMRGMMCPMGGVKGAMLALMVELLCSALTGAALGFEVDSFFQAEGNRPHIGHVFLVVDPGALAGSEVFHERLETLVAAMLADDDVRLPGARRFARAEQADAQGLDVDEAVFS